MAEATAPQATPVAAPPKKSKMLLWIALVVVIAGAAAAYFLLQGKGEHAAVETPKPAPALYYKLDPAFVVNFEAEQLVRFLQVTVELMTRDIATLDFVKQHDPVIRNDLLLMLSNQQYSVLATAKGKEELRTRALAVARTALAREGGDARQLEAVYFTSFVMQ
ncbi:MAG: flagellar basal body-associated protein FliL [Steroidobacteraceae bacterium]